MVRVRVRVRSCASRSSAEQYAIRSRAVRRVCLRELTKTSAGLVGEWLRMAR